MLRGFQEKVSDMPQWVCDMTQFFEVFFKVVIHRNLNSDKLRKNLLCWTTVWMQSRWVNSFIVNPTYRNLKVGLPNSRRPNRRCFACPSHRDVVNVENTGAFSTKKSIHKKRPPDAAWLLRSVVFIGGCRGISYPSDNVRHPCRIPNGLFSINAPVLGAS